MSSDTLVAPLPPVARAAAGVTQFHLFAATSLLFIAPNALFALALPWPAMALVLAGCAGVAALLWRLPRGAFLAAPIEAPTYALALAIGCAVCVLGGEGHFFYAANDWLVRDAVLADLVRDGVGVLYAYDGQTYVLRAPLGMYLTPALIGHGFGLRAAHLAMLAQNSLILASVLYVVARLAHVRKTPMLLLFMAYSGADIIPIVVAEAHQMATRGDYAPVSHIEFWIDYFSAIKLQYSSHVTQWFWAPNHTAPAWWFAALALLYVRGEFELSALIASCAAMAFWSPLAMMGAAPFVLLFLVSAPRAALLAPRLVATGVAGLCFLPILAYLTADSGAVARGWLIGEPGFFALWPIFLLVELPQLGVIAYAWSRVAPHDRRITLLSAAMLLALPVYTLGPTNDFVMRASNVALFIIAFQFCRIAVLTPRDNGRFATLISVIVILGFATPMLELKSAMQPAWRISDCNTLTAWHKFDASVLLTNYWARADKASAFATPKAKNAPLALEQRLCWPDHPLMTDHPR